VLKVGSFIRDRRMSEKLSLRKMAGLAGVSIPYLSQVERGLRKPSADILQAIARGLRISAETLYVQAGILEDRPVADVAAAIMGDPGINERQKQALVQIYRALREEAGRSLPRATGEPPAKRSKPSARSARKAPGAKAPGERAGRTRGGRAEPGAARTTHPTPLRSPTALTRREV